MILWTVCIDSSEITSAILLYRGWCISNLELKLFKQGKGGVWSSAIFFSHLQQGYMRNKIRWRPWTPLVQILQASKVMVQERQRGTIPFQINKRSYKQDICQENWFSFPISRSLRWEGMKTDPFCWGQGDSESRMSNPPLSCSIKTFSEAKVIVSSLFYVFIPHAGWSGTW